MRRDFDIFEKFPDGSILWRACIQGKYEAERKLQELAEDSENEFVVIDLKTAKFLPVTVKAANSVSRVFSKSA